MKKVFSLLLLPITITFPIVSISCTQTYDASVVFSLFKEINNFPRVSNNEERVAEFANWLSQKLTNSGANVTSNVGDGNLYAIKGTPKVCFQAHMDMVGSKVNGSNFDFENDPIECVTDGDWIHSINYETTCGADDGIGCAMILAMFQQFDNIEAIFTTHEEDTMEGALTIPTNLIQANKLINLDSEDDKYVTIGCNGGTSIDGVFSIATTSELSGFTPVTISITGGLGGHSGVDIHKGRCNTLKSIFYLLFRVKNEITSNTMLIHDVQRIGTIADNAIPSDASCQLYIPTANKNEIINCMQEVFANDIKPLYPLENALQISITNDSFSSTNALDLTSSNLLINNINFAPDGMYKYNEQYKMSDQSTNFWEVSINENEVTLGWLNRGLSNALLNDLKSKEIAFLNIFSSTCNIDSSYDPWEPSTNNQLANIFTSYANDSSNKMELCVTAGGLETAILCTKYPLCDMISIGPNIENAHTANERLSIKSTEKIFNLVSRFFNQL